jgi:hypothetical protein
MSTKNKTISKIKTSPAERLSKSQVSWLYFIPLLLIAGFVPLIVHGKYINLTGTTQALFWTGQNELLDFFSYWKSRWVIFLTITSTLIYIFLLISKKLSFKKEYKYYIPLAVYAFFVILSTIFAVDKPTALNGFVDMYQGMWVLLSYVMITFLVINFVNNERDIKLFLYAFVFLIIVEGIIGVGQYFGFDIFNTKFGNSLIIPSGVHVEGGLTFNFGKHTIYGTLFNTNFVGSFAALMLPIAVAFLIGVKTLKQRIVTGAALVLCLFTWIGCNSRAGYVGVAFSTLVALVMLRKYVIKYWKISVAVFLLGIVGLIGFNYISSGMLISRMQSLNVFKAIKEAKEYSKSEETFKFKAIDLEKDNVSIKTTHQNLNIKVDGEKLYFVDENAEVLKMKTDENGRLLVDDPTKFYLKVQISETYPGFTVITPWSVLNSLNFYIAEDGLKMIGSGGRIIEPVVAKSFKLLDGFEKFGSNRGYIWSRTIPLLNDYFIVGAGADNYPVIFPQDDYIAKLNIGWGALTVTDKPHNMYLQIAVNTGVVSLISLITIWIIYVFQSVKMYWKLKLDSIYKYIGLACFISIVGYLLVGIFNDHIVSVSPIFWCIFGLGISINSILKTKEAGDV